MSHQLKGVIKEIKENYFTIVEGGDNEIKFKAVKDSLKNYTAGLSVDVQFNVKGSQYQDKYFVSLEATKITY